MYSLLMKEKKMKYKFFYVSFNYLWDIRKILKFILHNQTF